jgi:Uma2 family endonuclease
MTVSAAWPIDVPPPVPVRRFTVPEYRRLGETGILTEDDRVELLEGWVVPKMVHNPPHDLAIELVDDALRPKLPSGFRLRIQSSITTSDSEPEPDLCVVKGAPRSRKKRHPAPDDVALVIEIADTSLATDRTTKARLYARARIASYWIVNLVDRQVEVHRGPGGRRGSEGYRHRRVARPGERVAVVVGGRTIASILVEDLLP